MIESPQATLVIEKTLEFAAPVDRVWRALTEPSELARWFPDRVEQAEVAAGADGRFVWAQHGRFAFRIEAYEPPTRLVWRWARDPETPLDDGVTTEVEWVLEARPDGGTILRLRESGFQRPEHRESNKKGWDAELGELVELLAS